MTEPFIFANGQAAHSSKDLIKLCQDFPTDGIRYLLREDLEKWLAYIGDNQNAQYATEARTAEVDDAKKLDSFVRNLQNYSQKPESSKSSGAQTLTEKTVQAEPVVVKEPIESTSVAVKEKPETTSVVVEKNKVENVVLKTAVSAEPEVKNFSESKTSGAAAKTSSKQEVASQSKSKSNLFHWIADFFRS